MDSSQNENCDNDTDYQRRERWLARNRLTRKKWSNEADGNGTRVGATAGMARGSPDVTVRLWKARERSVRSCSERSRGRRGSGFAREHASYVARYRRLYKVRMELRGGSRRAIGRRCRRPASWESRGGGFEKPSGPAGTGDGVQRWTAHCNQA
ncbi:hypothetical protein VUR80DRAFT_3067 [Thermomyces stellatus]